MRSYALAAVLAVCAAPVAALADTITNYTLNAATTDGATITGTVSVNQTTPLSSTATLTYQGPNAFGGVAQTVPLTVKTYGTTPNPNNPTFDFIYTTSAGTNELKLNLLGTISGYTGVCTDVSLCTGLSSYLTLQTGQSSTLTRGSFVAQVAAAATPEPSSLAMLATGTMGVLGMARRRFRRA